MTHCRCDPEVVSMHLFNVYIGNNGCICFAAKHNTQNTITVKISVGFFGFRVIQRNTRRGKTLFIKF